MIAGRREYRLASWAARASAAVAAVGIGSLVLLYVGLGLGVDALRPFGPLNDVCVALQYVVALPVVRAVHRLLVSHAPARIRIATLAAVIGVLGTAVLQTLLLAGRIAFVDQVGYVSITVLLIGVWIVITGTVGRTLGILPFGRRLTWLAALYFGYPMWMARVGRELGAPRPPPSRNPHVK